MARNYIENLREEVKKGMREKAEQGIYPSRPPIGYRNNNAEHTIEVDPEKAPLARRMFELYATGKYSLSQLRLAIRSEFGVKKSVLRGIIPLGWENLRRNPATPLRPFRKSKIAQFGAFELLDRCRKYLSHIQKAVRSNLCQGQK